MDPLPQQFPVSMFFKLLHLNYYGLRESTTGTYQVCCLLNYLDVSLRSLSATEPNANLLLEAFGVVPSYTPSALLRLNEGCTSPPRTGPLPVSSSYCFTT